MQSRIVLSTALLAGALAAQGAPSVTQVGAGCPNQAILYELFTGTGTGDLAGSSYLFSRVGDSYAVTNTATVETNLGTNLMLGDDQVVVQQLPFNFPLIASSATTNSIDINSNGWVGLIPGQIPFTGFVTLESGEEMSKYARIAGCWDDLDPSAAGGVFFNTFTGPNRAVITWDQVPQFGNTDSNSFQIVLFDNGDFAINWIAGCTDDLLTGFSAGGGFADPGSTDLSAFAGRVAGPYGTPFVLGQLGSQAPVIGQTFGLEMDNVTAGTGTALVNVGITPLTFQFGRGAPGCSIYNDVLFTIPLTVAGSQATTSVALPNDQNLVGLTVLGQGIAVDGSLNPLGAATTNGTEITFGSPSIVVTASGTNSFNSNTDSGFFKVENYTGLQITSLQFDWSTSSNPAQSNMVFDTDQTGMADRFDGGNSTASGCQGTYRNGSDVTTGLDYTTGVAPSCDAAADKGFVGSGGSGTSYATLDWTFSGFDSGEVLEFDCDTDFGAGISGGDMAGLVVTVMLSDGSMRTGELVQIDAENSQLIF